MPVYEFHCESCNRIFNFMAKTASSGKTPPCPKCGSDAMRKLVSTFSFTGASRKSSSSSSSSSSSDADADAAPDRGPPDGGQGLDGMDAAMARAMEDPRVERELMGLMERAEGLDEGNPREMGAFMRKMMDITGQKLDKNLDTAIRRLEKGEDPEKIEEDMGDILGGADGAGPGAAPTYDDGLYSM